MADEGLCANACVSTSRGGGGGNISVNSDPATIRSLLDLAASLSDVLHVFVREILP